MLHYPWTTDQKESQFSFPSEINGTGKGMNMKFKVFLEINELCGKPERLYQTIFESLRITKGYAMPSGELQTKECSFNAYQFSIDNTCQVSYTSYTKVLAK